MHEYEVGSFNSPCQENDSNSFKGTGTSQKAYSPFLGNHHKEQTKIKQKEIFAIIGFIGQRIFILVIHVIKSNNNNVD